MKKILLNAFTFISVFGFAREGVKVVQSTNQSVTLEITFDAVKKQATEINGGTYYKLYSKNCVPVLETGYPQVLRDAISIALPEAVSPKVEILSSNYTLENNIDIAPSKGSLTRNVDPASVPYAFADIYTLNSWYPSVITEVNTVYNLRKQNAASISFYPVQVNPLSHAIKVYTKLVVKITYQNARAKAVSLNTVPENSSEERSLFQHRFVNYGLNENRNSKLLYTPLNEMGSMLVISAPQFLNAMLPLVEWKNQKGINTQLVSTALTGTTQTAIKSYISTYYSNNPNLMYVLLVGDHEQLPSFNAGTAGSEVKWSDIKYGMILGNDWYPELMVGRFSGSMSSEISVMVNRTLEYEKNPTIGNWWGKAIGIGSNEGYGYGDDGEADWQHMRNMGTKLINGAGYNQFHEFYDSTHGGNDAPGDPTAQMVINAMNSGSGLFLYSGHGSQNSCATSNYDINDINASVNYGKYPFSLQVACNNGTFNGGTCFSEAFLRATGTVNQGPKGGIASCGSSILMAWAEPMQVQDEVVDIVSNQYPNFKSYTLGGLFYNGEMSMMDKYPNSGKNVIETWVMFGDPSCLFRSTSPVAIAATHAPCINAGAVNFQVTAPSAPFTYAALSQNNLPLGSAVVSGGVANILINGAINPNQNVDVVVTGYNKIPYIQSVPVCITTSLQEQHASNLIQIETLFADQLHIQLVQSDIENLSVQILDLQGKIIKHHSVNQSLETINTSDLSKGIYLIKVLKNQEVIKVTKAVKQ